MFKLSFVIPQSILFINKYNLYPYLIYSSKYSQKFLQLYIIYNMPQQIKREIQSFNRVFKEFVKPHKCMEHGKSPGLICVDNECMDNGIICSECFVSGCHRGHNILQISEFVKMNLLQHRKDSNKSQVEQILQIQKSFDELLKLLENFIQTMSNHMKQFIKKKQDFHKSKENVLFTQICLQNLKNCSFNNINQMNKNILILLSKNSASKQKYQNQHQYKLHQYLEDLNYQSQFLSHQFQNIQYQVLEILKIKNISPIIKTVKPYFRNPSFIKTPEAIYIGQSSGQLPNGKGIMYNFLNQKIILGNFSNGYYEGKCQLYFKNGDYYYGQCKKNKKEGRGTYRWKGNGNVYQGQFQDCKRNGRGSFYWSDGSRYQGNFKDGVQNGYGIMYRKNSSKEYEGNWLDGMFDGFGIEYFSSGEKYQGEFKKDKLHGKGKFTKKDGVIEGIWKQNQFVKQI